MNAPIPVNVITGALGVGKTSAIAKLLAAKPPEEFWVVILNEFTDAGLDAITLASAASGAYDVRVIPGGCLCCTGELDFRRQLAQLLKDRTPARILIEPSGIGHPGAVIEELRGQERSGALQLRSTIALVDPRRLDVLDRQDESTERAQVESADVLVLAKLDTASAEDRERFSAGARALYPPKRLIAWGVDALLSGEALNPPPAPYVFALPVRPDLHERNHHHEGRVAERKVRFGRYEGQAVIHCVLEREGCGWTVPREVVFHRVRLHEALLAGTDRLRQVDRLKAVVRTGIEHWTMFNVSAAGIGMEPCGWRQDSRIEVQLRVGESTDWKGWDEFLASFVA